MYLLLFDYDGVIADTFADMIRFAQETCDAMGVRYTVTSSDLSDLEVMSFATFGKACGVTDDRTDEFVRGCTRRFAEKKMPPAIFDGLADVIRRLGETNILAIVTGNTRDNVNAFLLHHGLQDCFRAVYGVDMPGSKAEKIQMAMGQFEAGKDATLFVGDSLSDIRAAKEAGIRSIAVGWGHQRLEMLIGGEPDVIVHSPKELMSVLPAV